MYSVFLDKPSVITANTSQNVYETITIDDNVPAGIPIDPLTSCTEYGGLHKLYFII